MNLRRSTFLLALVVPTCNAFGLTLLNALLDPLLDAIANAACVAGQQALGLDNVTTCECDGQLVGGSITAELDCKLKNDICLVNGTLFCGQTTVSADIGAGIFSGTGLSASATACFNVTSGFPPPLTNLTGFNSICITAVPGTDFKLKSCSVDIGTTMCASCTVCDSGTDIKFNCSNVDVGGALPGVVQGPVLNTCVGLSLIPTSSTTRMLL
jgi:hypothetical protein